MKKKNNQNSDEINFWQSSSDLMTALMLILLLIILLLILYLMRIPNREYIDYFDKEFESEQISEIEEDDEETEVQIQTESHEDSHGGGHGDGGGDDEGDYPETEEGEYPYEDEGIKSAVFAMLIDGETGKTIKEEGVRFQLRDGEDILQILNTYYPIKITYREFETTENGTFYLPEKIYQGDYYFRALSEATGYDKAEDTYFTIDELYDWPDALVVKIPAYPSRNIIKIQMNDAETKEGITGGVFEITAAEDIITLDGTLRYNKGDVVGEIVCDQNGYGESEELYLGTYNLKQTSIPEYYAGVLKNLTKEVEKKTDKEVEPEVIDNDKTKIIFTLKDELTDEPIKGATYTVTHGDSSETYTTDDAGSIVIDEVDKDTTYEFKQDTAVDDYIVSENAVSVKVNNRGRFGRESSTEAKDFNRMIRVKMSVTDAVMKNILSDTSVNLYDEKNSLVKSWTETGAEVLFTDLKPGSYYAIINGNEKKHYPITIEDTKEIQPEEIKVYTVISYLVLVGIAIGAIAVITGIIFVLRYLIRKRKKGA